MEMSKNLSTATVFDNEIMKRSDFQYGYDGAFRNAALVIQKLIYDGKNDFVIGGVVKPYISGGMNISISPLMAYEWTTKNIVVESGITEPISLEDADDQYSRRDTIEIRGVEQEFDSQTRAYKDPETGVKTFAATNTKKKIVLDVKVKKGSRGSDIAPPVDKGYVKLAEIFIPAGTLNIIESNIFNISARFAESENEEWTLDKTGVFNPQDISFLMKIFCLGHNDDGTHKKGSITRDAIALGTGANELNATNIPAGVSLWVGNQHFESTAVISTLLECMGALANDAKPYANNILSRYERLEITPRAASTQNIDIITGGEVTIDGIHCPDGSLVFLKNQTNAIENGFWKVRTGQWVRWEGFRAENINCFVYKFIVVPNGKTNGGSVFYLETDTCVIDEDELHFQKVTLFEESSCNILAFTNKVVPASSWTQDSPYVDYPFRAAIACDGVTADYSSDVRFDMATAISGELSTVTDTIDGKVYIYANIAQVADINVPVIIATKVK